MPFASAAAGFSATVPAPGKGRQVAGILLDNWLKGRRRACGSRNPTS
jgi:hypothetical protein